RGERARRVPRTDRARAGFRARACEDAGPTGGGRPGPPPAIAARSGRGLAGLRGTAEEHLDLAALVGLHVRTGLAAQVDGFAILGVLPTVGGGAVGVGLSWTDLGDCACGGRVLDVDQVRVQSLALGRRGDDVRAVERGGAANGAE